MSKKTHAKKEQQVKQVANAVLKVADLTVTDAYQAKLLDKISFALARNKMNVVIGEKNAGRQVLIRSIMGQLPDHLNMTGQIYYKKDDLSILPNHDSRKIYGHKISFVPANPMKSFNPNIKIGKQLTEILKLHQPLDSPTAESEYQSHCLTKLQQAHVSNVEQTYDSYPHQLSMLEAYQAMLAMAFILNPDIILVDGLTLGLDVTSQFYLLQILQDMQKDSNSAVLFFTSDCAVAAEIADNILLLRHGKLVEASDRNSFFTDAKHPYSQEILQAVPRLHVKPSRSVKKISDANSPISYMLDMRQVSKIYETKKNKKINAIRNVSLQLKQGNILTLLGEKNSGKSTLAKLLIGLENVEQGQIFIDGKDITIMKKNELFHQRSFVQMIFQNALTSLNPAHCVGRIISRELMLLQGKNKKEAWAIARDYLQLVGLEPQALDQQPYQFSHEQLELIVLARALAMHPKLLIIDEAMYGLDFIRKSAILNLLLELQARLDLTIILLSNDIRVATKMSDIIAVMHQGDLVEIGEAKNIFSRPSHSYSKQFFKAVPGREWLLS